METKSMKLTGLEIEFHQWGEFKGKYTGKVKYEGDEGAVTLNLDADVSLVVLAAIGQNIAAITQKTAANLSAIIEHSVMQAQSLTLPA
jgi:hypothetical protein